MNEDKNISLFYNKLKSSRKAANIDLEKISSETKISINHLKAIESGDYNIIPRTYLRLFIKTYAQYLNLDYQEILNNYEIESQGKNKKTSIDSKNIITKKIKKNNIKTLPKFTTYDSFYVKPKKIIQVIILFSFLISTYLLVSFISKKQIDSIENNTEINFNENEEINFIENEETNFNENVLLNSENFNKNNLVKTDSFKLNKKIGSEYTFQISTKEKTKIYISYNDKDGNRKEKCNLITKKGELIKYSFSNTVYFDLLSAKDVQVSINNSSINKYLGKEDFSIRGSFEPQKKQLYLEFYSR